jgi:hypothetical protein
MLRLQQLEQVRPETTLMKLMGIDHAGKATWIKNFGHTTGITTTQDPADAFLFRDYQAMRIVFNDTLKRGTLRNVAVQFVHVSSRINP